MYFCLLDIIVIVQQFVPSILISHYNEEEKSLQVAKNIALKFWRKKENKFVVLAIKDMSLVVSKKKKERRRNLHIYSS